MSPLAGLETMVGVIAILFWPGLLILALWYLARRRHPRPATATNAKALLGEDNYFHMKMTLGSGFVITVLVLALLGISERVLYDLARNFSGPTYDYFDNLRTIVAHAMFIIPVFVVSVVINVVAGEKRKQYAIALIPYFTVSILLMMQLLLQISVYFLNHYTKIQFYLVVPLVIVLVSYGIYYIQNRYHQKLLAAIAKQR